MMNKNKICKEEEYSRRQDTEKKLRDSFQEKMIKNVKKDFIVENLMLNYHKNRYNNRSTGKCRRIVLIQRRKNMRDKIFL